MFTIAICDDEPYFLENLSRSVSQYMKKLLLPAQIITYRSGEALLQGGRSWDILLLDQKLPGRSGTETAKQLRSRGNLRPILFISSYKEYVFDVFDLDAVNYLIKPVSEDRLASALDKAMRTVRQKEERHLTITKGTTSQVIPFCDILFCEALDHRIFIHTTSDQYDYFGSLGLLQKELDGRFFRCHRSYIINLSQVIRKEQDTAVVTGGKRVLLSRRKQQEFTSRLMACLKNEVL